MPPVFYSFRRCPYAMRARLALASSGVQVELREILLRDKPQAFLDTSPSGTVPCLSVQPGVDAQSHVIDESLDIMLWALDRADPQEWLDMPQDGHALINRVDGEFKTALDRTKYATRYPDEDPQEHRAIAAGILNELNQQIDGYIYGKPTLADFATLPFVRQFAFIDKPWFDAQPWPKLQAWLAAFLDSAAFAQIMSKYPPWQSGDAPFYFPE
ncbi:glutathione S-transferase [Sulfitobacter sp. F26204]|uniref:glutathione S-transferase n=1 Tax=Sulfitobacter sp. F26204 TaxID=2996014 RepID=UPI00225E38F2|nr:glutathione S-transferase [Sulfitobacter sp. F26204]MCX7558081.1 glutathione S-transferase [Sulfitobacter sp. F26204]